MKYIIKENQAGFVVKDGKFIKMIRAGKYNFSKKRGYDVIIDKMTGEVSVDIPYDVLATDKLFKESTVRFQLNDGEVGFIFRNHVLDYGASKREYVFWNVFDYMDMKVESMEETKMSKSITKKMLSVVSPNYYAKITVNSGEVGLLYYNNEFVELLKPGTHYYWKYKKDISYQIVDMKLTSMDVLGQEILTKDKVGIRMNISCSYRITDAKGLVDNIKNYKDQIYSFIQLTIRELVGKYKLDEILEQKVQISEELRELLASGSSKYYVEFVTAGIKDIILPGEIREIMNTVLVAEKKAQANVIARREEVASTRSLLNTAKLMDDNKTLYKLKELEYLEKICESVGEISVSSNGEMLSELSKIIGINN